MTKQVDFHGVTFDELPKKLDTIMHESIKSGYDEIELITGRGSLQEELMDLCIQRYECSVRVKIGNAGVLVVSLI